MCQTHQERDSLASWEVRSLLLIDLGSPLASPDCPLFPSDFCSRKGEGLVHVCVCLCVCVCARALMRTWLSMSHLDSATPSGSSQYPSSRFDHRGAVLNPTLSYCVSWGKPHLCCPLCFFLQSLLFFTRRIIALQNLFSACPSATTLSRSSELDKDGAV